jgi:hypothetical protein
MQLPNSVSSPEEMQQAWFKGVAIQPEGCYPQDLTLRKIVCAIQECPVPLYSLTNQPTVKKH